MDADFKLVAEFPFQFYGEEFTVGLSSTRKLFLPFPLVCDALKVDLDGQVQRVQRDEVYDETNFHKVTFTHYPYGKKGEFRPREVLALRLDMLPYFMGGIETRRIEDEDIRKKIVRFKKEFARVAWGYFRSEILGETELAELDDAGVSLDEQQYNAALDRAAQLRREMETRQAKVEQKQATQGNEIKSLSDRVAFLEAKLLATNTLNESQLKDVQDMIGLVAKAWEKKGESSTYWKVHESIKGQFDVHSYLAVPEESYPELQAYLLSMYKRFVRPGTPIPTVFLAPDQRKLF